MPTKVKRQKKETGKPDGQDKANSAQNHLWQSPSQAVGAKGCTQECTQECSNEKASAVSARYEGLDGYPQVSEKHSPAPSQTTLSTTCARDFHVVLHRHALSGSCYGCSSRSGRGLFGGPFRGCYSVLYSRSQNYPNARRLALGAENSGSVKLNLLLYKKTFRLVYRQSSRGWTNPGHALHARKLYAKAQASFNSYV